MIKPHLLRTGNWLFLRNYGWIQVKNILEDGINASVDTNGEWEKVPYSDLEHIPLNPEILEKSGLSKLDNRTYYFGALYFVLKADGEIVITTLQNAPLCTCIYLDEMQNAIFILRGIELEVNKSVQT